MTVQVTGKAVWPLPVTHPLCYCEIQAILSLSRTRYRQAGLLPFLRQPCCQGTARCPGSCKETPCEPSCTSDKKREQHKCSRWSHVNFVWAHLPAWLVAQGSSKPGVTLLKLLCNNVPPRFCPFPPCAGSADVSDLTKLQKQKGKSPWSPWLWGLIVLA